MPRGVELLLGVVAGLLPLAVMTVFLFGGIGGERAPGPVVVAPTPSDSPVAEPSAQAAAASATSAPAVAPTPSPEPATPNLAPTPRITAAPPPETAPPETRPPPEPEPPPATEPPAPPDRTADGPKRAVRAFYAAVEDHDWDTAIGLWSPAMQERYPPGVWLIDRFRPTTRIDITRLETLSVDRAAGLARVAVTLVEHRTVEPSPRTFVGAWDVVRIGGRWVLNAPYF